MGKKRLLYVLHSLQVGGAERLVVAMADALAEEFAIGIVCLDEQGTLWETCRERGYRLYHAQRTPGWHWSAFRAVASAFRDFRPDIVHAHQYTPYLYAAAGRLLSRSKAKLIFTEHGRHFPDVVSSKRRLVNQLLQRCTSSITAVSEFSRTALLEKEGINSVPVEVIYNGLLEPNGKARSGIDLRAELGLPASAQLVGYVGSLRPVKNPLFLLQAFRTLASQHENAYLVYLGDGPLRGELEAARMDFGLEDRVFLLGQRTPAEPYLKAFDVFVLPSHCEAASLALLEAMSCAVPVVVTDRGGSPELVEDGKSGLVISCGAEDELAAAIGSLLEQPSRARELAAAAQERQRALFSFEGMLSHYRSVYEHAR